ncbi:ABC transporter permease [Acidipropionibacterium timonense]|uniref:ABC transporter permease n=1 Tax=Acidipropionibacterium timonense TaxID=2161818 RepID=UPI001031C3B5|nr:ABC transporter permease subunit [Acidipropionibacterium timonense]
MSGVVEARAEVSDRDAALAADPGVLAALNRRHRPRKAHEPLVGCAVALWVVTTLVILLVPDTTAFLVHGQVPLAVCTGLVALVLSVLGVLAVGATSGARLGASRWLGAWTPWWVAIGVVTLVLDVLTAKTAVLRPPYVPPPGQLLTEAWTDRVLLGQSIANSALLLVLGLVIGGVAGLLTGLWMGWSRRAGYWFNPIVKYIGPVPTLAWIPIVFLAFPDTFWAAVFLVSLTVWFPMTVLTNAGIRSVPKSYFDVCQTLGASTRFLVLKVSLPAALPNIFTGIFMALPTAFVTLTIAETLGVNSGLGWYINWKKGWSAYPAMYAAIAVMVVLCGSLLSLELAVRNRVLAWQKDLTRW